jgi:hypothetical protein
MSNVGKMVVLYALERSRFAQAGVLRDAFQAEVTKGSCRVAAVDDPVVEKGRVSAGGQLEFTGEGESWIPVLNAVFDHANAAFFSAWDLERSCSEYRPEQGRTLYPVKAVIFDPLPV